MTNDVEDILEEAKQQDRTTTKPGKTLDEAAADAFAAIDEGNLAINITVRDKNLAALFEALEEIDGLQAIEEDANGALDRDVDAEGNKASLARALLRVGFNEVAPEAIEEAATGYEAYLDKKASEQTSNF